ncbi:hypothetical protein [Desulfovibrio inopinatus]|uniref:hypothetical protein n=1 Tax=Desulfovibrio inopinatus TaxID=102109 RepID=UPI00042599EA|nr:hypothetical protein [Desulfovibrio inopinatus]
MKRWKMWAAISAVFLSGAIIGAVAASLFIGHRIESVIRGEQDFIVTMTLRRLDTTLDLTREEREKIAPIVKDAARKMHDLRREQRPKVTAIVEDAAEKIKKVLPPEKSAAVDDFVKKFKQHKLRPPRGHLPGLPPPPPPPLPREE